MCWGKRSLEIESSNYAEKRRRRKKKHFQKSDCFEKLSVSERSELRKKTSITAVGLLEKKNTFSERPESFQITTTQHKILTRGKNSFSADTHKHTHTQTHTKCPRRPRPLSLHDESCRDRQKNKDNTFVNKMHVSLLDTLTLQATPHPRTTQQSGPACVVCDPHRRVHRAENRVDERGRMNKKGRKWRRAKPDRQTIKIIRWSINPLSRASQAPLTKNMHDTLKHYKPVLFKADRRKTKLPHILMLDRVSEAVRRAQLCVGRW